MYLGLNVKCRLLLSDLMKVKFSRYIFAKHSSIKFHENASSMFRLVPCGRTDVTKLIVSYRKFSKSPKNVFWKLMESL